jgi:hypothetical protein
VGDNLGGKIGTRVAELVARARMDAIVRMRPELVRTIMAVQDDFFRLTGSEVARTVGPLWRRLAEQPDAPGWLRDTGTFLANGKGQWATLLAGQTTGALMGGGVMALITDELQPVIGDMIRQTPNMPLSPADAAAVDVRGLSWGPDLWTDAGQSGINRARYEALKNVQRVVLSASDVLELLRRGEVSRDQALDLLSRAGWDRAHGRDLLNLARTFVSIQDAAAMWNRDILTTDQGRTLGRLGGYTDEDFDRYALLGGEPPDLTAVIMAWQRGIIDEHDVDRAIVQGPIRKEWIPVVKALRWVPLPVTEAADAVNQGHMSLAAAQHVAALNGLKPEDFQVVVDNAGIPPGPQEALDWVNRGILTEAEFRVAFLESRIKNKYIDRYLESRHEILTMAEIRSLYAKGAMSAAQATTRLMQRGYTVEDAGIILAGAHADKTQATRDLTRSDVVDLYETQAVTLAEAQGMLGDLGYSDEEIVWLLALADARRVRTYTNAVIARVKAGYVGYRLDQTDVVTTLDSAGVPAAQREALLDLWNLERQVVTTGLSTAQVQAAFKRGFIDQGEARVRLRQRGYSEDDAAILLALTARAAPTGPA